MKWFRFWVLKGLFKKMFYSVGCWSLSGSKEPKRRGKAVPTLPFVFSPTLFFAFLNSFFSFAGNLEDFISVRLVPVEKAFIGS